MKLTPPAAWLLAVLVVSETSFLKVGAEAGPTPRPTKPPTIKPTNPGRKKTVEPVANHPIRPATFVKATKAPSPKTVATAAPTLKPTNPPRPPNSNRGPTKYPTRSPSSAVVTTCSDNPFLSSGAGSTTYFVDFGVVVSSFDYYYDMADQPDSLEIKYQGNTIFSTGGPVSGTSTGTVNFAPGASTQIELTVIASNPVSSVWQVIIYCPIV